jgi:hypothetical protein
MNHGITEGLRKSLADLRENEERCRDAALAIQRVLEAEGALYPAATIQVASGAKITILESKPAAIKGKQGVVALAKNGPRTWPKTCTICGEAFDARSASAKCCSAACVKEKNVRYARAGYQAQKPAAKRDEKAVAALDGSERVCAACGKKFTAHRKDQKCCSTACGKSGKGSHAPKVLAPAAKLERANAGQPTRLERIRAAAERMDGIPESVRAAAAEARESEVM